MKLTKGETINLRVVVEDPDAAGVLLGALVDTFRDKDPPHQGLKLVGIADGSLWKQVGDECPRCQEDHEEFHQDEDEDDDLDGEG